MSPLVFNAEKSTDRGATRRFSTYANDVARPLQRHKEKPANAELRREKKPRATIALLSQTPAEPTNMNTNTHESGSSANETR